MIRIPSNSLKIKNIRARNILHLTKNNSGGNKTDGLRMVLRPTSCRRRRLRPTSCRRRRPFVGTSSNQWSRECALIWGRTYYQEAFDLWGEHGSMTEELSKPTIGFYLNKISRSLSQARKVPKCEQLRQNKSHHLKNTQQVHTRPGCEDL